MIVSIWAALAFGTILASIATPAQASTESVCRATFAVAGAEVRTRRGGVMRATRSADSGACIFEVSCCVEGQAAACGPASMTALTATAVPRGATFDLPPDFGASETCVRSTPITLRQSGRRPTRLRLTATVASAARGRRRQRLVLVCKPGPTGRGPEEEPPAPEGAPRACESPLDEVRLEGRRADFPPSMPIPASCGGELGSSNYVMPETALASDAAEELHVIGVYEGRVPSDAPRGPLDHPEGTVRVTVRARPRPVVLFLSAYQPVRWRLTIEPGASVARVITHGFFASEVDGLPAGTPVERLGRHAGLDHLYGWEVRTNLSGGNYWQAIRDIRARTGLVETSFQGCSTGFEFEIPHWSGEPPTCRESAVTGDEVIAREAVRFPGCEAVMAEDHYCLTTSAGKIALLGLESGRLCPVTPTRAPLDTVGALYGSSIAWRGEVVYACTVEGLVRVSLRDGTWEAAQVPCQAVAGNDGALFLLRAFLDPFRESLAEAYRFPDYAAVLRGDFDTTYPSVFGVTRMTVLGNVLYAAWHATDTIERFDLQSGEPLEPVRLPGYRDWILGLAVTDDGYVVVSGPGFGRRVIVFEAASGTPVRNHLLDGDVIGLSCVTRPTSGLPADPTTTTTTTLAPTCRAPAPGCCLGAGFPTGGCGWEAVQALHDPLFARLCDASGGHVEPGYCAAPCGPAAGCCTSEGCPAYGVFGNEADGATFAEFCAVHGGMAVPGRCTDTGAARCGTTGCSGQLCADRPVTTTCEWRPEYACYRLARCEPQADGACGWTATPQFAACVATP